MFYAYHDHYLSKGIFVGKDQTLINALLLLFPHRFLTLWARTSLEHRLNGMKFEAGMCGPHWYFYEFVLANGAERGKMNRRWAEEMKVWQTFKVKWLKLGGPSCTPTRALPMDRALRMGLGSDWRAPDTTIRI